MTTDKDTGPCTKIEARLRLWKWTEDVRFADFNTGGNVDSLQTSAAPA